MSAAKFMNILALKEQQYIDNQQQNSYNQFKQTMLTLGFQKTQTSLLSFKNNNTPSTSDNSPPFYFSKQDKWQQQQDQLAQQQSQSASRTYFAQYPNKMKTNIEDRYQQHNNQTINRILSVNEKNLLLNRSNSPKIQQDNQNEKQMSSPQIKKSNLKIRTEAINIRKKKTVKIIEYKSENDKKQTNPSPNQLRQKTRVKTVQDYLGSNSSQIKK